MTFCDDPSATLDDIREAVTTLEEIERTARRVLGCSHPETAEIEGALRSVRRVLRIHEEHAEEVRAAGEAEATEATAQDAFRTARVELAQERSELAASLAGMRVADDKG